jgi:hypothetical protein
MNSQALLDELDAQASTYDFPVLDNAYWKLIAGRLRGFRSIAGPAVVFEIFTYHTQAQAFLVNLYGFGSPRLVFGSGAGAFSPIQEVSEFPLWGDDGEWLAGVPIRVVDVNGKAVRFTTEHAQGPLTPVETVRLSHGDTVDEAAFGRAVARELGLSRVMEDAGISNVLAGNETIIEVVRMTNWDHPDVIGGQRPSSSTAISQVAKLVCGEISDVSYDHRHDNVESRCWET